MLKASGAIASATLASRILGMVREIVYANFMGGGLVNDAFQLAFTAPNLFRRLLGEGALTAAFIPIFKEKEKREGETEMWRASNAVISGLLVSASVIVGLVVLAVSLALGVHSFDEKTELMLRLLRIMFPYMILVCLTAVMMGMLNSRGHFFVPALGAALLNVVMIASVLWLAPCFGPDLSTRIFALAIGVLVAGVAQASFQIPTLWRDGFRFRWVTPWRDETVRRVVRQMLPGTVGVAAFQINVALVQSVAFVLGTGLVSSFNYAVRLMELPQGMFGVSLATYLLPTLSGLAAEKKYPEFRSTLSHGLGTLLFLNFIAATLLFVLAEPIVRLLYQHGKFGVANTESVTFALQCLVPGLVAFSTVNILARAFYALGDTTTPMKISLVCLGLNFTLACGLLPWLRAGGPGLANTLTSALNAYLLVHALRKKLGRLDMQELRRTLGPLTLTCLAAGLIAGSLRWLWTRHLGHDTLTLRLGEVFVPASLAGGFYILVALWLRVPAAAEIRAMLLKRLGR